MATHKQENGEYENEGQDHLCQKDHPEGISCSRYGCSITYTGSMSSPDEHHQRCSDDRPTQLPKYVPPQVKMMHLPMRPERQRYGRVDMPATQPPEWRNGDERTTPRKQETRDESTDTCIGEDLSQR